MASLSLPTPSPRQLEWHKLETYAFVHFGPNTFTGEEWGHGDEKPEVFNPKKLDCRQWTSTFKAAGLKGVIITAKHHDGFALWPSRFTDHTVAQSSWRGGKGDVLKELSEACRADGLKFGVYVSPWDRNHPTYGTPEYNQVFANMLREVLTNYGPVFEVWFDGANGEGPNGKKQVYDWDLFKKTVRELQPNAVIFGDGGPDVRWVGNEQGYAGETNWATLGTGVVPGTPRFKELTEGHEDGTYWAPAECDVSIRPGWFWRASEDDKVKSVEKLMDIYFGSVGRGGSLLLNVPPTSDGLISSVDANRLVEFRQALDTEFAGRVEGTRDHHTITFAEPNLVDMVVLREDIEQGQRVRRFRVEAEVKPEAWLEVAKGTTIGPKRILRFPAVRATRLRVVVEATKAEPFLSEITAYR